MIRAYTRAFFLRIWETLRDGFRLWWIAPVIPLIAALPEFAQHCAEIRLGMFDSLAAFRALQNDPLRWAFGYAKIAGLFLALFAAARFWAQRDGGGRWWDLRTVAWRPLLVAVVLSAATSGVAWLLLQALGEGAAFNALNIALQIATLPVMVLLVAGVLGDRTMTLREAYRSGWVRAVMMGILFLGFMAAPQPLHRINHDLAMGAAPAAVWALMVWDSLLVGAMAALGGTGLHHGYRPLLDRLART